MEFWETLTLFQRIVLLIALPFTVLLFIQFVMQTFGLGGSGGDTDVDVDGDGVPDDTELPDGGELQDSGGMRAAFGTIGGLKLFTFRGIVAFFVIGGWTALAVSMSARPVWAALAGIGAGAAADLLFALAMKLAMRLQESGSVNLSNAVGLVGEVYVPIPPQRIVGGKINLELQGKLCEIDALSDEPGFIKTGEKVVVTLVLGNAVLVAPASGDPAPEKSQE